MEASTPGHVYACWYPVGTPEGRDALARNEERGGPAPPPEHIAENVPATVMAGTEAAG
jgi:hypothetical protein